MSKSHKYWSCFLCCDVLQYTVIGFGDYEGQTQVYIFTQRQVSALNFFTGLVKN
jgi:hypothetical protein